MKFRALCSVDRACLYNLVNKTNLMHNLFLVYLSLSTSFGRLCAHHQEKQLCLCDTLYLLFCVDDCLLCIPNGMHTRQFVIRCSTFFYLRKETHLVSETLSSVPEPDSGINPETRQCLEQYDAE
jgi:hypothetical protein